MRPRPGWLLLTLFAMAAFGALGMWQWQRGAHKLALQAQFVTSAAPLPLGSRSLAQLPRFARVQLSGHYDPAHQFLLDNMFSAGRPGYQVLTPLHLVDGRVLLVNRGWLPFGGYRERLPEVSFAAEGDDVTLRGRLDELPAAGLASGRAPPSLQGSWPRLTSFPQQSELVASLGGALGAATLEPRMLLLDADQPLGYVRDWQPPGLSPQRHIAYAVQWWAFALLALVLLIVLNRRKTS
jgi:surfeit locus 1 family protein